MLGVKITIDGKPFTSDNFQKSLDDAIFASVIESITSQITSALTPDELSQITINFNGSIKDLKVVIDGPDILVEKATNSLESD